MCWPFKRRKPTKRELLRKMLSQIGELMATLDQVLQDATDESTLEDSIIALLQNIKAQLDAILGGALTPAQQAQVDAVFTQLEANKAKVAAAITANTPPPPPAPAKSTTG